MSESRRYQNAPITEAIIDLRVEPVSRLLCADALESVGDGEKGLYPDRKPLLMGTGYLQWGEHVSATASSSPVGTRYASTDGKVIWQARTDDSLIGRSGDLPGRGRLSVRPTQTVLRGSRRVCVEVRKGEPRPFSLDDLTE